jgi:hypothetical protein
MLFLTPDNDFAGEDQVHPLSLQQRTRELLPSSLIIVTAPLSYMTLCALLCWFQVISLEEIKEATSKL